MAKKKQSKEDSGDVVPATAVPDEEYEEDELELLQVDLGDMVKMKQILDETVTAAILEKVKEDYWLDNVKLSIMVIACLFAMIAQFAPIPFPDSRPVLGACCCMYFVFSTILQFITTFIDKDCILITQPMEKNDQNVDMTKHGLRVRSQFPRFSEFYTVILEFQGREDTPNVEQKWSVGQFFDKEGTFDEIGLTQEVHSLFARIQQGRYDSQGKAAKKNQ